MKEFIRQETFTFTAKVAMMILCTVAEMTFSACSSCSHHEKQVQEQSSQTYDYSSSYTNTYDNTSTSQTSQPQTTTDNSGGSFKGVTIISDQEAAYEDGRALGEEDRLNGTRQHEGDYDDEEYSDDYDEGYEEAFNE